MPSSSTPSEGTALPIAPVLSAIAMLTEACRRGRPLPISHIVRVLEIPRSGLEEVLALSAAEVGGELGLGLAAYAVDEHGMVHSGWGRGYEAIDPQLARQQARSTLTDIEKVLALVEQAPAPAGATSSAAGSRLTAQTRVIGHDSGARTLHIRATDATSDVRVEIRCPATDEAADVAVGVFAALPTILGDAMALTRRNSG